MYHYSELGQVNTKLMFQKAYEGGYAIPAFNFVSIEQFNGIMDAVIEKRSPVILLASPNLHKQLGYEMLARIVQSGPALDHDYMVGRNCDCEPKYHERFLQAAGYSA